MASKLDLNELIAKRRQEYLASQSAPPQPPEPPKEQLVQLPLTQLEDFPADRHPFRPGSDSRIQQLRQDIVLNGVLSPLLVRSLGQGHYQILAGHNRKRAAALANYTKVPCIIRDVNEDEAVNIMLSDNLMQRDDLLPSEKAFAYKMKLEAMKRQGQRADLTSGQVGPKLRSDEQLALDSGESRKQVQRFIRLTELIPALLEKVDEQAIGLTIGCTLSYLTDAAQEVVYPLASLFVFEQYQALVQAADARGGRLQRRVNFVCDEFGNFVEIPDFDKFVTVGGGRGIRFTLYIQDVNQIYERYGDKVGRTICSNCETWIYLQTDDDNTLKELSGKLGKYTIKNPNVSGSSNGSSSASYGYTARDLLDVAELKRIRRPYQLVMSRSDPAVLYAPDISQTPFNTLLGMGNQEHNRRLLLKRCSTRPIHPTELRFWGIWEPYISDIKERK